MKEISGLGFALAIAVSPSTSYAQVEGLVDILVNGGNEFDWEQVELPGTVCGNGSQYKFYVHDTGSPNLLFYLEGGGACWDYDLCSGRAGTLGAANPNGIEDDYIRGFAATYVSPIVNGADPGLPFRSRTALPTEGWNIVYLPYCTGDVHTGNNVVTYEDPTGVEPPLVWNHAGFSNTVAAADYAAQRFPNVDKMVMSGYSAGGTGTSSAYFFVRERIDPAQGFLLNDSGPIHFAPDQDSLSRPLHEFIRVSWDLDSVFSQLPPSFNDDDFGSINDMVAIEFPEDQIAYTGYLSDYNYSRFSYERFYPDNDQASVLARWRADQEALVAGLSEYDNVSYFIPWERPINDSHCSTIITFVGSHACEEMEKKRRWWEYFEFPWGQSYKCYSEFVPMETFLDRWIEQGEQVRIVEPENGYNAEDPGMQIIAPLIAAALEGT
ncbi:MAG: hypothetical protein AAGJ56_05470 [Myxococcota bacterium]